jgi:uncharacterized protein YkwD
MPMRLSDHPGGRLIPVLVALLALQVGAPPASAHGGGLGNRVTQLVNGTRADRGLVRLEVRAHLNDVALDQALRMARRGAVFHNPDLVGEMVGDWLWVGENVGQGMDLPSVHADFLASPAHRANVLDGDFTRLGGAVIRRDGRVWVVQVFLAK